MNEIFIRNAPNAIAMFDRNMRYLIVSQRWLSDYNISENIIGRSHYEIFPEIGEEWKKIHRECLNGAVNICEEASFVRQDGETQWISWEVRPWTTSDGSIGGIIMNTADITKRKKLEQDLAIQTQQFVDAFSSSSIGMAIVSVEGAWTSVNNSLCELFGYTKDEFSGMTFQDITHPDDLETDLALVRSLIDGLSNHYTLEKRYLTKSGKIIWGLLSVSIVRDTAGKPIHFVSQIQDITRSKNIAQLAINDMDKQAGMLAIELHENIAQTAASIKLMVSTNYHKIHDTPGISIENLLSTLINDITSLSKNIFPSTVPQQTVDELLEDLVNRMEKMHNLKVKTTTQGRSANRSDYLSIHLYKLIEYYLLIVVITGSKTAYIDLLFEEQLTLRLDGALRSNAFQNDHELLFLHNIQTRVELLQGKISTFLNPESPFHFQITIPLNTN